MKLSHEESLEMVKGQAESDFYGWEMWPDGSLMWLEDGVQLQMVVALDEERLRLQVMCAMKF